MIEIKAFKALTYNPARVADFNQVVCPPYDVISPEAQEMYYQRSPDNFIHVLLAKDIPGRDKYQDAREKFRSWVNDGVLIQDDLEAIYFYSQQYNIKGEKRTRFGFISLLRLGDNDGGGGAFGHENTHTPAKEDRFRLMKLVKANLSPIFIVFQDKKRLIRRVFQNYIPGKEPFIEVTDEDKTVHKLWKISDPELIMNIRKNMLNENAFIADGHHRYEVACVYRDLMRREREKVSGDESFNYLLSYFTNTDPRGLSILSIHRLLAPERQFTQEELRFELSRNFEISEIRDATRFFFLLKKVGFHGHLIGMYRQKKYWLLRLKNPRTLEKLMPDKPKEYRLLDPAILNHLVFKDIFGLDPDNLKGLTYSQQEDQLIKMTDEDPAKIAFFLNPVKIEQIMAVALQGCKMPPKSTYFYPKVLSGLVINKVNGD